MTPEQMAALGQAIASLPNPRESATDAARATAAHRLAGTDLGPLTDRVAPDDRGESLARPVKIDDLLFDGDQFVGIATAGLRGSVVAIWQISDPALRAIALEASGLTLNEDALTEDAILTTLQHGSTPIAIELARRDLEELLSLGCGARLRGREPFQPRPDRVVIRRGLQTGNVAAIAAGLLAAALPEDIGPRFLSLGMRIEAPDFQVAWISQRGVDALNGAVSARITDGIRSAPSGHPILDRAAFVDGRSTAMGRGIAPAALLVADLPDDPRLPPLVLALQVLDLAGQLTEPPEDTLRRLVEGADWSPINPEV